MLVSKQVLLIKTETTPGVAEATTAADAVLVNSVSLTNANARMIERPVVKASLAPLQQIFGGMLQQVQFTAELKGSGTAGTAPELDAALQACGFEAGGTPSTDVVYKTSSGATKTATIVLYQDGVARTIAGCVGTVSFTLNAGEVITADFTFTGKYSAHADGDAPTGITYDTTVPVPLVGLSGFLLGSTAIKVGALTFDVGNNVTTPADISDSQGYGLPIISTRDVTGTLDPEMVKYTDGPDFLKDWMDDKTPALTTGDIGETAGNIIKFDCAAVSFRDVQQADRDGLITEALSFAAVESTLGADGEFQITFS